MTRPPDAVACGARLRVKAGARGQPEVEQRLDVLVFSSDPLGQLPVEIIGDVAAELFRDRDNPYAILFVRLCDRGSARALAQHLRRHHRLADADRCPAWSVSLSGAAHRFGRGHRIRLQVSGGAHPLARNPGNGRGDAPAPDLRTTGYEMRPEPGERLDPACSRHRLSRSGEQAAHRHASQALITCSAPAQRLGGHRHRIEPNRCSSAPNAISASSRASGSARQLDPVPERPGWP